MGATGSPAKGRKKKAATKRKVVRKTGHPLYLQVRDYIEERIDSSRWGPGTMIPREKDLCRELDVSRITVREAMRMLVHDGKLERVQLPAQVFLPRYQGARAPS